MLNELKLDTQADLKILIADDHKMVAGALSDFLTKIGGFEVYCAHSLDETLGVLTKLANIDIIMLDLKMPGMTGITSVKSVLDAAPESKVVIFSAYADTVMLDRALQSGVKGFIPKSLAVKSLPSILRLVDSGQTFFPFKPMHENLFSSNKDQLTKIEISIVHMIADGATNKHIANEIGQTETTVKMLVRSICKKLGAKNRAHAAILGRSLVENGD
jgi:two-component system nitrate/nitrite response regulator NarP